jgi:para-aminobenzoate synthetase component 1
LRTRRTIPLNDTAQTKQQLLIWAQQFREIAYLESNDYPQKYASYDCLLAADAFTSLKTDFLNAFEDLKQYQQSTREWLFGYLSYDLKNDTEDLQSSNFDGLDFPDLYFFQPKKLFLIKDDTLEVQYLTMCDDEIEQDIKEILSAPNPERCTLRPLKINQRISKEQYLEKVSVMLEHINRGDIYEANFCMELFSEGAIDPLTIFHKLNAISEPPFAAFFKKNNHYAMSASPERFLRKQGSKIISQPIKGTARRSVHLNEDAEISRQLTINEKERAENIMIVDLVRNDLSKTAAKGTVEVEELCGAYAFRQVHHLISTVVSEVDPKFSPVDIIKEAFPMGSMTGAPKISAMNIIEKLEETKRGLYSGAIGYFTPEGDFDFNVVIRSILYNAEKQYVSFSVGSAITAEATPEAEYEECLLKAKAMLEVLS